MLMIVITLCLKASADSETECDWWIFREKDKIRTIGLNVKNRINSHNKTYTPHEVFLTRLSMWKTSLYNCEIQLFLNYYFSVLRFTRYRTMYQNKNQESHNGISRS